MLISKKHNFIFIHIFKNAGTSIQNALWPYAAQKWQSNKLYRKINAKIRKMHIYLPPHPYPSHITASDLIDSMGEEEFKSFFSFAIVRNPWDWQVSFYKYVLRKETHHLHDLISNFKNFEEYLEWRCSDNVKLQKDFIYSEDDQLLVDFVGRFENLNEDFDKICDRIGINSSLPKLNVSNTKPYRNFYTEKSKKLVQKYYEPDISLFNYEF